MRLPAENHGDLLRLVNLLASNGRTFTISTDLPVNSRVSILAGEAHPDDTNFTLRGEDANCIEWVYVPGEGLKCVKRR